MHLLHLWLINRAPVKVCSLLCSSASEPTLTQHTHTFLRRTHAARSSLPVPLRTPAMQLRVCTVEQWVIMLPRAWHSQKICLASWMESALVSNTSASSHSLSQISLPATLISNSGFYPLQVFIDSDSDDNFIDENKLAFHLSPWNPPNQFMHWMAGNLPGQSSHCPTLSDHFWQP